MKLQSTRRRRQWRYRPAAYAGILAVVAMAGPPRDVHGAQSAQEQGATTVLSDQQIEQALQQPKTRGFKTRGLMRQDTAESAPSINLNIAFEYNSSTLKPQASAQLKQLEAALKSPSLVKDRFAVAGHTDAKGSPKYNKQLSLRRAYSVRQFLVAGGIDPRRLDAIGYGSEQLLAPERPEDPSNRRVEIRDLGEAPPER